MDHNQEIEISFSDNFFTKNEQKIISEYCTKASYFYGETDNGPETKPTGLTHDIPETELVYKLISKTIYDRVEFIRNMKLYRMYINCFAPGEDGYFHNDGKVYTFIYYPNLEDYEIDEGGQTQFIVNDNIHAILPVSNRMVIFNGLIRHRATALRNHHRFSIAIKYAYW